jgi:hypothetical protein
VKHRLASLAAAIAVVSIIAGCSGGTPAVSDPKEIVTKAMTTLQAVKTVHLRAEVSGTVDMSGLMGGASGGSSASIPLDGTNIEGDLDIAAKNAAFAVSIPAFLGLKLDMVQVGQTSYSKVSLDPSGKWQKSTTRSTDALSSASDPQKALGDIQAFLDKPEVAPKKLGDEKCGDKDCYHVQMTLPAADLAGALGSPDPAASPPVTSALLDLWVEKDSSRLAKAVLVLDLPKTGKLTVTLTMSKYDAAVTIVAPPADQVVDGPGLFNGLGG